MRAVFKQIRFEKSIEEKERFAARILALFVLFVSSLFFCRCNSERKFDGERVEVLLIGDWVLKEPKSNYEAIYVYSFFKENNASIFPLSKSAKYYCRQDTLVIDSQLDYYFRHDSVLKSKYFFKILKLDM